MEKKKVNSFLALVASKELTIREIFTFSKEVYPKMMDELNSHNIETSGNIVFISYNRDGNIKKKFHHEICIPVNDAKNYSGEFSIKEINTFNCVSEKFTGTMKDILTNGINKILAEVNSNNIKLSNQMREVYHHWEKARSKKNVVEIQFGIL